MARVNLQDVHKSFGKIEVIHGISCDIEDGEFIVLLGPSGCGKSTVLRMIAGLESVTSGEIFVGDTMVNQMEPADRDIAMVFQNYALYPHMSVFKNMAYGLKIRRMPKAEIEERVRRAAEILELTDYLDRKPRQLSGGQRQRVAMGRCIVREPKVFLFDEPLSNLDAKLRVQMRLELRNLHNKLKVTSIYVTHDQVEAMTLGDRLVVINEGCAEQIGSPLEVYEKPATVFVAGFIGSPAMNLFRVVVSEDGTRVMLPGGGILPLPERGCPEYRGKRVIIGLRPEHFSLAGEKDSTLDIAVNHVETLGADTLVHGLLNGESEMLTVRLSGIKSFAENQRLSLNFAPAHIHLFDPESEQRIVSGSGNEPQRAIIR
ncbi:MAG: sn-glycerol-3-phosphate import ATP-binding protein UgpC [Desulfofustis sp.]|jgi:sn-glycerol 3-phosphate transport system ATP-binding protein|nr:sn-glycerol-3-phosphate import ATP-binding protein UgpC [Desulfofustis sp.]